MKRQSIIKLLKTEFFYTLKWKDYTTKQLHDLLSLSRSEEGN